VDGASRADACLGRLARRTATSTSATTHATAKMIQPHVPELGEEHNCEQDPEQREQDGDRCELPPGVLPHAEIEPDRPADHIMRMG
jgi:hypothetical protein